MQTTQQRVSDDIGSRMSAEQLAGELKKLSDAILFKNHKATDEVKDAVRVIANELERTAETIRKSGPALATLRDEATVQGHLALLEAKDKLTLLDQLVRTALDGAATSPTFIGETARLKLALARMDAADLFEEKRRLLKEESRRLETLTETTLREIDQHLAGISVAMNQHKPK